MKRLRAVLATIIFTVGFFALAISLAMFSVSIFGDNRATPAWIVFAASILALVISRTLDGKLGPVLPYTRRKHSTVF